MIKKFKLDGKIRYFELFLPPKIKEFLNKNKISENKILNNKNWEDHIIEDLEKYETINFEKAKIVIRYIHINQNNKININPKNFSKGKTIVESSTIVKGGEYTFSDIFSVGYSIFAE